MPRFANITEIKDAEGFNAYFTDYMDEHPLDFAALDEFLKQYVNREKVGGAAIALKNHLDNLKISFSELNKNEEGDYDAYSLFKTLNRTKDCLYNFLGKYGFDLSSNPLIEKLADFNNQVQLLGMAKGSIDYTAFYSNANSAIAYFLNKKSALKKEIADFCVELKKEDLDHDTLSESLEHKQTEIQNLKEQLKKDDKEIENYRRINIRTEELRNKINNDPELTKAHTYETYFEKMMNAFDYQKQPELSNTDKQIEETQAKISKLEAQIDATRSYINSNISSNMNYKEAVFKIEGMARQKEMADKGMTSDILGQRYYHANNAFEDLSRLSAKIKLDNLPFKKAMKDKALKAAYDKAKMDLIDNLSTDPERTLKMRQTFSDIEKNGKANAIDLLVVNKMEEVNANLYNLKNDAQQLVLYEEAVKMSRQTKDHSFGVETAKANLESAQKELEESKAALANTVNTRNTQRKAIFKSSLFPKDDIDKVKSLSNSAFYSYLASKKNEFSQKINKLLSSSPLKESIDELKKISEEKSLHTLNDLEGVKRRHEELLTRAEADKKKLEKHIETRSNLKKKMADMTDSVDKIHKDLAGKNSINRKYENLEESLISIKNRLGKLEKGSSNTTYYENMFRRLNVAIGAVKTRDEEAISAAIEALGNDTNTYISEKGKQKRPFPSPLRKLRLNAARDLQKICSSKELLNVKAGAKEVCDKFVQKYKPGQSEAAYNRLKNKALDEINKQTSKTEVVNIL